MAPSVDCLALAAWRENPELLLLLIQRSPKNSDYFHTLYLARKLLSEPDRTQLAKEPSTTKQSNFELCLRFLDLQLRGGEQPESPTLHALTSNFRHLAIQNARRLRESIACSIQSADHSINPSAAALPSKDAASDIKARAMSLKK